MLARTLWRTALSLVLGGLVLGGCGGSGEERDKIVRIGAVSSDLTVKTIYDTHGRLVVPWSIQGNYGAACKVHAGEAWDLVLNDPTDRSVEVVLNDTFANCPLTMTGIDLLAGADILHTTVEPPVVLGLNLANMPSQAFLDGGFAFYTNAELDDLAGARYTNDFTVRMIYSDDEAICTSAPPATYETVFAAAEGSAVPTPDYHMALAGLALRVDADLVVQGTSSGALVLYPQQQVGEEWKIFDDSAMCCGWYSFADIDHHYLTAAPVASGGITGANPVVFPWDTFGLLGQTLPQISVLVVKHTGEGGVYSYELFQVTFPGPIN